MAKRIILVLGIIFCAAGTAGAQIGLSASDKPSCAASVGGLNFICGVVNPEDLAPIPSSRWLIASGYDPGGRLLAGSGLKLVDTDTKTFAPWYTAASPQRQDQARYPFCTQAPDAQRLVTHGLYLHAGALPGSYMLYAVTHSPREEIEIFTVDANVAVPTLTWNGCVPMPADLKANSVAAFADGTILATVLSVPRRRTATGLAAGIVLQWKPGEAAFQPVPGTDLPSDNGLELSKNESEFYVVGFGDATVSVFSRKEPSKPIRSVKAPGFVPDNLRWSGDVLVATGPIYDEPACGGTRAEAAQARGAEARKPGGGCNRGYIAAALDPATMRWKILAYGEPNPQIGIIATGVIVGDTLWIGAALSPGLAYRTLPGAFSRSTPERAGPH